MRFLILCLFIVFGMASFGHAQTPLPIKKPSQNNLNSFEQIIETATIEKPIMSSDNVQQSIIKPPPLPSFRSKSQSPDTNNDMAMVVHGIPIPTSKPLAIRAVRPPPPLLEIGKTQEKPVILYQGNDDDRTAGRQKIERIQAAPRERIRETSDRSPFQTAQLPRARKSSQSEPVIIFFKEQSSELEVGQLDVIKSDILRILNRSPSRKVAIYGYAERNNASRTNQLSLSRALLISEYLVDNGIRPDRIEARSMGSDTPISPKNRVDVIIF